MQEFKWYYSLNGGESFYGPHDTRDEVIEVGNDEADGGPFEICEATKGRLNTALFHDVAEKLDDWNDDNSNPDGDPISAKLSKADWSDLEDRLNAAVKAWADERDIHRYVWAFEETRNHETIEREKEPKEVE
jgi:hypothetical protein